MDNETRYVFKVVYSPARHRVAGYLADAILAAGPCDRVPDGVVPHYDGAMGYVQRRVEELRRQD